jgi:hypothetical protein
VQILTQLFSYLLLLTLAHSAFADPVIFPKLTLSPDDFKVNLTDPHEVGLQLRDMDTRLAVLNILNNVESIPGFSSEDKGKFLFPQGTSPSRSYFVAYLAQQIMYSEMALDKKISTSNHPDVSKDILYKARTLILQTDITEEEIRNFAKRSLAQSPFQYVNNDGYNQYLLPKNTVRLPSDVFRPVELESRWRQISASLLNRVLSHPDPEFKEKALSHLQCSSACCLIGFGT